MLRRALPAALPAALTLGMILGTLAAPAAGRDIVIGKVTLAEEQVNGTPADESPRPLKPRDPVEKNMWVKTEERSAALIAVGARQGAVTMGPRSQLLFRGGVVDVATGAAQDLDFFTQVGQFRFVFVRQSVQGSGKVLGAAPHEVVIHGPKGKEVKLHGTDIYIAVTPAGDMSVWVVEGTVDVNSGQGASVRVGAGQLTRVIADGPPTMPAPFRPAAGLRPPDAGGAWLPSDPPFLDLRDPRLDLPK